MFHSNDKYFSDFLKVNSLALSDILIENFALLQHLETLKFFSSPQTRLNMADLELCNFYNRSKTIGGKPDKFGRKSEEQKLGAVGAPGYLWKPI